MKPYLNRDIAPEEGEHSSWLSARNMLLAKGYKSAKNEKGTTLDKTFEFDVIGLVPISDGFIVFSTNDTWSEIGVIQLGIYTKKLRTAYLGFRKANPIECVYKYNYNKELLIAFTDATQEFPSVEPNTPKLLNLDKLPFKSGLYTTLELINPDEIKLADLFPDRLTPQYNHVSLYDNKGGKLLPGSYYIALSYYIDEFDTTGIFSISRPFHLMEILDGELDDRYQSAKTGEYLSKSLNINITGLDTDYKYVEIYTIFKVDGSGQFSSSGKIIGKYIISDTGTASVLISSLDNKTDIDLSYVLLYNTTYTRVKTMTTLENKLYLGNLETDDILSYQKYANNIKVKWRPIQVLSAVEPYTTGYACDNLKQLQPEEVYALYIGFIKKDGTYSRFFHIPGRVSREWERYGVGTGYSEKQPISEITNPTYIPYFGDELQIDGSLKIFHTKDTADTSIYPTFGELGFYQNESENYPKTDDFYIYNGEVLAGSLRGTNVRHHKMPSLYKIQQGESTTVNYQIQLQFEDVYIPDEIADKVDGIVFAFAKRNFSNSTVVGEGVLLAQQWWLVDGRTTQGTVGGIDWAVDNYRAYSYNMLWQKPNVAPVYTIDQCKIDQSDGEVDVSTIYNSEDSDRALNILKSIDYYPDDNLATDPPNDGQEAYIKVIGELKNSYDISTYNASTIGNFKNIIFKNHIENVYGHFYEQDLALMEVGLNNGMRLVTSSGWQSDTAAILGDCFVNSYKLKVSKWNTDTGANLNKEIYLRETSPYNIYTRYYEHRSWEFLYNNEEYDNSFNIYEGNLDYIALHSARPILPYNPIDKFLTQFPNRLSVSIQQLEEFKGIAWREFLTSSYFETIKNRDVIWKLDNDTRDLLVECKYGTFVAQKKDELQINEQVVASLGDADIFATTPRELIPDDTGYVGCQSQFASFRSKLGNIIVDRNQGKIFLYNGGQITEISKEGVFSWFYNNLEFDPTIYSDELFLFDDGEAIEFDDDEDILYSSRTQSNTKFLSIDNPYNNTGISAVWDEENERFIFSKNDGESTSFTISYSPNIKKWISFHDYTPNLMSYNPYGVYLVKDNKLYTLNTGNVGEYFGTTYASYIDVILNEPINAEKLIQGFAWNTEVKHGSTKVTKHDKTFEYVVVFNYNQHSNKIELVQKGFGTGNVRKCKKGWRFSEFRDVLNDKEYLIINTLLENELTYETLLTPKVNTNWYDNNYFINNFVVIRLIMTNANLYDIIVHDVTYNITLKR